MKTVFVSNYFNHHQRPLAQALAQLCDEFHFIETTTMRQERKDLGYGMQEQPDFVLQEWKDPAAAERLIAEADLVIAGSAPEKLLQSRIRAGKLVFRYSERPLRNGPEPLKYLPRLLRWHRRNPAGKPIYMLCAGAFVAGDYHKFGLFNNRMYRWGYFPKTKRYDTLPEKEEASILWCGRFLDLKHPDDALLAVKRLRDEGYVLRLDYIGTGAMEQKLRQMVTEQDLQDCVRFLGAMKPDEVRGHMERAAIFLFTSDKQEGWGAVLNEAMNSGCAVVASDAIGSVPFLVCDGSNGLVYTSGDRDSLYSKLKQLLDHPQLRQRMGAAAYRTIAENWNAETAARRLMDLAERVLAGEKKPDPYVDGPCSRAQIIREEWYRT